MITIELSDWAQFKQICITRKNLNCQYAESSDRYDLYGPDANGIIWHTNFLKDDGADQVDFETNYKDQAFNYAIGNRSYSFATPDFIFGGDSVLHTVPKGTTENIDLKVPGTVGSEFRYVDGAVVITKNAEFGDYASAKVVDVDNILGYGAGVVISSYVTKWYINPAGELDVTTPYAGKIPSGLYMRVTYTSVGSVNDVGVAINYRFHKPL